VTYAPFVRLHLVGTLPLLVVAGVGCRSRDPHAAIDAVIDALDRRDTNDALDHMVSPSQLTALVECPASAKDSDWLTAEGRRQRLDHAKEKWLRPTGTRVRLGDLFEDYDRPAQWPTYRAGETLGDCRVKQPFGREVYRVVLVLTGGTIDEVESTKPIEIWRIDGKVYVWDDPLDTEPW
jgi:hypothetical protein